MQEQRVTIRQRVLRWWRESAWAVIGATAVSSLLLGAWGFQESLAAEGKSAPLPTLLYLSLQLFALEFGIPVEQVTWQLETARIVAPVLAAYAAIRGALSLFSERVDRLWVGRMRNHVVICGLGEKGSRLASGFLRRGDDVVVIERDQATAAIGAHRDRGATVIVGDAAD